MAYQDQIPILDLENRRWKKGLFFDSKMVVIIIMEKKGIQHLLIDKLKTTFWHVCCLKTQANFHCDMSPL